MSLRYSRRALRQLEEILAYIATEDRRTAEKIALRFNALAGLIGRQPTIGRPTDFKNVRVFRAAPYPYLMFYHTHPISGDVTILRVRHTARKEDWSEGR